MIASTGNTAPTVAPHQTCPIAPLIRHPSGVFLFQHDFQSTVAVRTPTLAKIKRNCYLWPRWRSEHAGSPAATRKASSARSRSPRSLYEAVAQGLRVFREDDWSQDANRVPASVVVTINQPQVEHRVRIKDFENWLDSTGRSPAEMALKSRLRDIIGR